MDNDDTLVMPTSPESLASPDASQKIKAPIFSGKLDDKKGRDDFPEVAPGYVTRRDQFALRAELVDEDGDEAAASANGPGSKSKKGKGKGKKNPGKGRGKGRGKGQGKGKNSKKKANKQDTIEKSPGKAAKGKGKSKGKKKQPEKEVEQNDFTDEDADFLKSKTSASFAVATPEKPKAKGKRPASAGSKKLRKLRKLSLSSSASKVSLAASPKKIAVKKPCSKAAAKAKATAKSPGKAGTSPSKRASKKPDAEAARKCPNKKPEKTRIKANNVVDFESPIACMEMVGQHLEQLFQDCEKGNHLDDVQFVTAAPVRLCPYRKKQHMGVKTQFRMADATFKLIQPHYFSMKSPCYCSLMFLGKQLAPGLFSAIYKTC